MFQNRSLVCRLAQLGADSADKGFHVLSADGELQRTITFTDLHNVSLKFAANLREHRSFVLQGTIVLALPAGEDFVFSYFGCLVAGLIAVPIKMPQKNRSLEHTINVFRDSGAKIAITTKDIAPTLRAELPDIDFLCTDDLIGKSLTAPKRHEIQPEYIAHLQYTSGSTSAPKGVAISHRNILANAADMCTCFSIDRNSRLLSWLPHFHDFGLVFGCLVPVATGCNSLLMSPTHFAQKPVRWLQALDWHRVTHSGAPNFAYDACLALPEDSTKTIDLSRVQGMLNGAEPVRAETVLNFANRFAKNGLRRDVQCPSYGMAENTLAISGNGPNQKLATQRFDADALVEGRLESASQTSKRVRELVVCNGSTTANQIRIVDPDIEQPCPEATIGEIWVTGDSIASGYWQRESLTVSKFNASLQNDPNVWLRTGDLGGILDGNLYIIGRIDDVMVLRGINYSPEDIEQTIEACDPALNAGGSVAFAGDIGGTQRLVIAHEVTRRSLRTLRKSDAESARLVDQLVNVLRERVADQHDLELGALLLLPPNGLPKTHTGKKQRNLCRQRFQQDALTSEASWTSPRFAEAAGLRNSYEKHSDSMVEDLTKWLRDYAESRLNSRLMDERRTIPPYVVMDFGNKGLLGMVAPQKYGGLGLSNTQIVRVVQQLAAVDTTLASFTLVNNALGLRPILRYGQPELVDRLMPTLATGRELASFAMTEADAGSNIRNLSSSGRADPNGGWRLYGRKLWSGTASWAGVINTFVRLVDSDGTTQGVTGFVLEADQPGLRHGPEAMTMGLRAMVQNEVILDGVHVTNRQCLGAVGDGMTAASDAMEYGRFAIAAMSVGVLKRCLQLMLRHAGRRSVATGPLIENPATALRISELSAATHAIEALVTTVAEQLDADQPPPIDLYCACKTLGPEFAWQAADGLIQQLAGRGYIETNVAPQILRDARVLRIFEGPTEPMHAHIGARLVHIPDALTGYITEKLGAMDVAKNLSDAAQDIWAHHQKHADRWGGSQAAKSQAHLKIGELATYAILIACLRYQSRKLDPSVVKRASEWAHLHLERHYADALTISPAQAARLERQEMDLLSDTLIQAIGNIQQAHAGTDEAIDPILQRCASTEPTVSTPQPKPVTATTIPDDSENDAIFEAIVDWLRAWIAAEYSIPTTKISSKDRFAAFGMDSVSAMRLVSGLEDWTDTSLPPTLVWDFRTLEAVATHVAALPGVNIETAGMVEHSATTEEDPVAVLARLDELSEEELQNLITEHSTSGAPK